MRRRSPPRVSHAFHPRLAAHTAHFDRAQLVQNLLNVVCAAGWFEDLLDNAIDQSASDRDFAWKFRQLQYFEPICFLDFSGLRPDLAAAPLADEGDHQRMRERPGLAREVAARGYRPRRPLSR